nr:hypothetical protein Iba_chr04aCG15260 [Ipomoea batatas]GMC82458.1 hypothetical protein Iba_chr04bCG13590 [Ipomoea batatas]GMC86598.1 hypothetical protein Iba_chr04dCG12360 [Ipomoea batatas]
MHMKLEAEGTSDAVQTLSKRDPAMAVLVLLTPDSIFLPFFQWITLINELITNW